MQAFEGLQIALEYGHRIVLFASWPLQGQKALHNCNASLLQPAVTQKSGSMLQINSNRTGTFVKYVQQNLMVQSFCAYADCCFRGLVPGCLWTPIMRSSSIDFGSFLCAGRMLLHEGDIAVVQRLFKHYQQHIPKPFW